MLLSPELAKSTCGLCEFVQCAQLSLERAVDLRIFSVSAVSNVKIVFVFFVDVGIRDSIDVGVGFFC